MTADLRGIVAAMAFGSVPWAARETSLWMSRPIVDWDGSPSSYSDVVGKLGLGSGSEGRASGYHDGHVFVQVDGSTGER